MCGIHGFMVGKTRELNADDFIKNAFVTGMLRGTHSSGIVGIDIGQEFAEIQKLPVPGMFFIEDKFAESLIRSSGAVHGITICHTRAATQGQVNMRNAHPFRVDDWDKTTNTWSRELIGVHNGTLTGWAGRPDAKGYNVDSEWAMNHIFKEGFDAFEDFNGAYCFVWWDSDSPKVLNIALNTERPMHVAFTKDGNMGFASEAGMVAWLFERNKIERDGDVRKLEPGTWYKFHADDIKNPAKISLPKSKTATTTNTGGNVLGYQNRYNNTNYTSSYESNVEAVDKVLAKVSGGSAKREPLLTAEEAAALAFGGDEMAELNKAFETINSTVGAPVLTAPAEAGKIRIVATAAEQLLGKQLAVIDTTGQFFPEAIDAIGVLKGTFKSDIGSEWEAIMRHADKVDWSELEPMDVKVMGCVDDGMNLTLVLSKPRISLLPKETVH